MPDIVKRIESSSSHFGNFLTGRKGSLILAENRSRCCGNISHLVNCFRSRIDPLLDHNHILNKSSPHFHHRFVRHTDSSVQHLYAISERIQKGTVKREIKARIPSYEQSKIITRYRLRSYQDSTYGCEPHLIHSSHSEPPATSPLRSGCSLATVTTDLYA